MNPALFWPELCLKGPVMSVLGDQFKGRRRKANTGLEPASQPGRRCVRCQKDMSNYVLLTEATMQEEVCNECHKELRNEDYVARWKAAKPPVYDIDVILGVPDRKPWDVVKELNSKIDPDCPESLLLGPELVVRDFEHFSSLVGHDFGYIFTLNGSVHDFLHGLRAMRAIGATHLAESMTKIREFAVLRGVVFPEPLPDPWLCDDITIDKKLESELTRLTDELKPYEGFKGGDLHYLLVNHLRAHIESLRQRKPV